MAMAIRLDLMDTPETLTPMSEPKRYTGKIEGSVLGSPHWEHPEGEWVKWTDYARLKAEVERHVKARHNDDMAMNQKENPLLIPRHLVVWWMEECKKAQAEVERVGAENAHLYKGIYSLSLNVAQLKSEVERLTKAGDDMAKYLNDSDFPISIAARNDAKEGKQS